MNASCGIWTEPMLFIRFLPSFCFFSSFILRVTSPPYNFAVTSLRNPLMVSLALLALPVLMSMEAGIGPFIFGCLAVMLILSMMAPSALYVASQKAAYPDWASRMIYLPFLICVGVGIAVSNTRAVFEALIKHKSGFIRTPKKGDRQIKNYRIRLPFSAVIEILLGIYCAWSLAYYLEAGKYLIGPFLAIYACGFLFIGLLTVVHGSGFFD